MQNFRSEITRVIETKSIDLITTNFSNEVYYSNVNVGYVNAYECSFSIKYVIDGIENYNIGDSRINIEKGQYLIVNNDQTVECLGSNAEAMSFFLDRDIIDDIIDNLHFNEDYLLDNPFDRKNRNINFFENLNSENDELGNYLKQFYKQSICTNNFKLSEGTFYDIGINLVKSQLNIYDKISDLNNVKFSTKCELYKRALLAKLYIESIGIKGFNLDSLCKVCYLSKYHLIRTFKTIYNTTPYNYYLNLKINHSLNLLKNRSLSITEVAENSGFPNVHAFSKRFKLIMAMSPSEFRASIT